MTEDIVVSRRGIAFTRQSVESMLRFGMCLPKDKKNVLLWMVTFKSPDHIEVALGAGGKPDHPDPKAIDDEVDGVLFYWYTNQSVLDQLRNAYYFDFKHAQYARVIPLPKAADD